VQIELKEMPSQPVLYIRTRTSQEKLPQVIGESYQKIAEYMIGLGTPPMKAPYAAYYNLDMQDLDVEMGFPASPALPESGDIKAREIAAGKAVCAMYQGPYSEMEAPYGQILKWIEDNGYQLTGVSYEYYHNSPQDVPASELLTGIVIPVK
jgi:effector-binding domain-containing protein